MIRQWQEERTILVDMEEITCDICGSSFRNEKNYSNTFTKCEICKKDVCDKCYHEYYKNITDVGEKYPDFIYCKECKDEAKEAIEYAEENARRWESIGDVIIRYLEEGI